MKISFAFLVVSLISSVTFATAKSKDVTSLQIGIKYKPTTCPIKSQKGDKLSMHYTGTLVNGDEFDSSLARQPFSFTLGAGQVIQGWDKGLLGMCVGEKRKLQIPGKDGYGDRGSPPKIPADATLIFEVELLDIENRKAPEAKDEL